MTTINKCRYCDFPQTIAEAAFCTNCGARLAIDTKTSQAADRLRFLGGELRLMSVFFVNFVGLESLLQTPTYNHAMLYIREYLNDIEKIIHDYDGTAHQIIPDSRILGLFGAPKAHMDDNRRTINCVLDIQQWWQPVKKDNSLMKNIELAIGINTGRAFFGYLLEESSFLTVIGDTINTASRITDICPPGEVLISQSTNDRVQDFIATTHLGERSVKGKAVKINVFLVKGRQEEKAAARQKYPIFGREHELKRLLDIAAGVRDRGLAFCIISGQMGIGKSRLKEEFEDRLNTDPSTHWVETHCSSEIQSPFFAYKLLLQKFLGISDFDGADKIDARINDYAVRQGLAPTDTAGIRHLLLTNLRRLRSDELQSVNEEIFSATRSLIRNAARDKLQVLVFEEFNRADRMSKDLTSYLIAELDPDPVMFLMVNVAREYLSNITTPVEEVNLAPLAAADIDHLVHHILEHSDDRLVDFIYRAAGGNPLFTIETIRNTRRTNIIKEVDGCWTLDKEQKLSFLDDLYSVIMSTIDSLPLDYRLIIDYASVIGYSFNRRILGGLLERSNLDDQLQFLVREGYLTSINDGLDPQYGFRHNLLKDAAYTVLPLKKRKEIHQQTALLYEDIYRDQLASYYEDIGHHYLTCENFGKAANFYLLAGNKAKNLFAFDQALFFYDTVLKIQQQAAPMVSAEVFRDVLLNQTDVFEVMGDIAKMERAAQRGLELCRRGADPDHEPLFGERHGFALLLLNRLTEAEEALLAALEQSQERPALSALLYSNLGDLYIHTFEYERSILNYNLAWNTARGHDLKEGEIPCLLNLAKLHRNLGNYEQALEYLGHGLESLIPAGDIRRSVQFKQLTADILTEVGNLPRGRALFEDTAGVAEATGILEPYVKSVLGLALLDAAAGLRDLVLDRLTAVDRRISFFVRENLMLEVTVKKAYIFHYLQDPRAAEFAAGILRTATKLRRKDYEFHGHWLLAQYQPDQSLEHAQAALEIAESIKLPPLVARGLHLLARTYKAQKDPEHALFYGMKALHIYDELKLKLSEENGQTFIRRPEYVELLET